MSFEIANLMQVAKIDWFNTHTMTCYQFSHLNIIKDARKNWMKMILLLADDKRVKDI